MTFFGSRTEFQVIKIFTVHLAKSKISGFLGLKIEMRAPIEIFEEGRIHLETLEFKDDSLQGKTHFYRATFLFRVRGGEINRRTLVIDTDDTFTYILRYSLNRGPMKSGESCPEWLRMAIITFNKGGQYDESVERALRLIRFQSGGDQECYYQLITRREMNSHRFLANRPVNGPCFRDTAVEEEVEPEKAKSHYAINKLFRP